MAIIGEIRDKGGVLVLIFVGISLIAFLLMDATSSSRGATAGASSAGTVNDKDVNINLLNNKINQQLTNVRSRSGGADIDEVQTQAIRDQVWNSYVSELVAEDEYEKLGLTVSNEEMADLMMGTNPHPFVRSSFTNPETNQFDNSLLQNFIEGLEDDDQIGNSADKKANWRNFKDAVKKDVIENKYKNLIKKASYVPDFLALNEYYENNNKVSFDYFVLPFSEVTDAEIDLTDADLQSYLDLNKDKFDDEATRSITYVEFPIVPTKADSLEAKNSLVLKKKDFINSKDEAQFVNLFGDLPYNDAFITNSNIFNSKKKQILAAKPGQTVGPYYENDAYMLAKIVAKKQVPDSVECRHILINTEKEGGIAEAEVKVDSLITLLKGGADFDLLAADFSEDKSNADNGGYLNWAKPNQMVKPFNDLIFYDAKPKEFNKVQTQFGWHIVQVIKKKGKNPSTKVAYLAKRVEASGKTQNDVYRIANRFAGQNRTPDAFAIGIKKEDLIDKKATGLKINDFIVEGIAGTAREIVQWAFNAQKDQVSDEIFAFDDKFVVAKIDAVREKGEYTVEALRNELTDLVMIEKKGEKLVEKINSLSGKIDNRAKQVNTTVKTAENINLKTARLALEGPEPKVVGAAFTLQKNEMSKAIIGNKGVYQIQLKEKIELPEAESLDLNKQTLTRSLSSKVDGSLMSSLSESVEVEDTRYKFY